MSQEPNPVLLDSRKTKTERASASERKKREKSSSFEVPVVPVSKLFSSLARQQKKVQKINKKGYLEVALGERDLAGHMDSRAFTDNDDSVAERAGLAIDLDSVVKEFLLQQIAKKKREQKVGNKTQ